MTQLTTYSILYILLSLSLSLSLIVCIVTLINDWIAGHGQTNKQ
jgi:hypothetical protein